MDIFGDEKYKQLDWLTKAVEPITWSTADLLITLPDSYIVTIDDIKKIIKDYSGAARMDVADVFRIMIAKSGIKFDWDHRFRDIVDCYQIQLPPEGIKINLTDNTMSGPVELIKFKESFTEEELQKKIGRVGAQVLNNTYGDDLDSIGAIERVNEVLDLMGIKTHKHKLSRRLRDLKSGHEDIMFNNKWKIRNVDLSNKVGEWIKAYITTGNLAAFTNFCKVKAITHRGYPIYSIEEEI